MRSLPWGLRLGSIALCVQLIGCGTMQRVTAEPGDYDDYRRAKLSPTFEARLRAGWYYLRARPDGDFRGEVLAWFGPAEERYVAQAWKSRARLTTYLEVLPDGPHAGEVRRRLAELENEARSAAAEENSFMRRERDRQRQYDEARRSRAALRATVTEWVRRLATADEYGKPIHEWGEDFRREFFETEPPGLCDVSQCVKTMGVEFLLPTHEGLRTERANFDIVLHFSDGVLRASTLRGHGLFSRLSESANLQDVGFDDLQARAEAIGTAVVVLSAMVEPLMPHASCSAEALSPTVLLRQCEGRKIEAIVGENFQQPDLLEIGVVPDPGAGATTAP